MGNILEFKNIDAGYGRTRILNDLSFEAKEGQILGVIGPNGSGKSTMFNTVIGSARTTRGSIFYDSIDITRLPPHVRCKMGIGRTYQIPRPFEKLSVYENVLVAAMHGAGLTERGGKKSALQALKLTGLYEKRELTSGELTLLDRKRLEIARAIGTAPKLLLLDEVAAGLTEAEVKEVISMVETLKNEGYSIIWIEHIIDALMQSADHLMCMAEGRNVICGLPSDVIGSSIVEQLYLGVDDDE